MVTFGIQKIHLVEGTTVEPPLSGMTVFTGPNNTGKSLLLRELVTAVHAQQDRPRWVTDVEIQRRGSGAEFIDWLAERGVRSVENVQRNRAFLPGRYASDDYGIPVEIVAATGSSLNPEVEVYALSGGDGVDQGLEFMGWVRVRPGLPPAGEGDGGGEPGPDGA